MPCLGFHLFDRLIGPAGESPDTALVDEWLIELEMHHKLDLEGDRVTNVNLSQGQRKRLAMLLAVAEQRDLLLLDEWAADQDPQFRRIFYRQLHELTGEERKAASRDAVARVGRQAPA